MRAKWMLVGSTVLLAACSGASGVTDRLHHMTETNFGCQHLETAQQIIHFHVEGDEEASLDYIRQNIASGECEDFSKGTPIYLEESRFDGLDKIRAQGNTTSYWTVREVVGP